MSKENILERWKSHLASKDRKLHAVGLLEIVEMFNNVKSETAMSAYVALINSDIVHFLQENINYREKTSTILIIKIVCHLSETTDFFKNDFFRMLKGFSRVINSFPISACNKEHEKYHQDIFTCLSILVKRAYIHGCDFACEQMPLNCLIINVSGLTKHHLVLGAVLDFVNTIIELMTGFPAAKSEDETLRTRLLLVILTNVQVQVDSFKSVMFTLRLAKILHNSLNYIPKKLASHSFEHKSICELIIVKFLVLMDFVVDYNEDVGNNEIFCNMFYYLLTSKTLASYQKLQLVNQFFVLNGHQKLVTWINIANDDDKTKRVKFFKTRVVFAEVLHVFIKFVSQKFAVEELEKKTCYKIIFMADMKKMNPLECNLSSETFSIYIFMEFINLKWKKTLPDDDTILTNISYIFKSVKDHKVLIHPAFLELLKSMFISLASKTAIHENPLLKEVSNELLKAVKEDESMSLQSLKWLKEVGDPDTLKFNEAVMKFVLVSHADQFVSLEQDYLKLFDQTLITEAFTEAVSTSMHNNLCIILCQFPNLPGEHFKCLLLTLRKLCSQQCKQPQKIVNVLEVISAHCENLDQELKNETVKALITVIENQRFSDDYSKIFTIEIACKLITNDFRNLKLL